MNIEEKMKKLAQDKGLDSVTLKYSRSCACFFCRTHIGDSIGDTPAAALDSLIEKLEADNGRTD